MTPISHSAARASGFWRERRFHATRETAPPRVIIAIPARDEAERVGRCLQALAAQSPAIGESGRPAFGVLLFVNGSGDGTFERAVSFGADAPFALRVYDAALGPGLDHAGGARRVAMDLAAAWLEQASPSEGFILSTDADSAPAPDWIARVSHAFALGADAVAGRIELFSDEAAALSPALRARGEREGAYEALLTEMFSRLDPLAHDPWPRHASEPGANFALRLSAYRAVGGSPVTPSGEDRALARLVEAHGLKLRHDPASLVETSGRLRGRARGGVADALSWRTAHPQAECDPYLEAAPRAFLRGFSRGRLRRLHAQGNLAGVAFGLRRLGLACGEALALAREPSFQALWPRVEALIPALARRPLRPRQLALNMALARAALAALRGVDRLEAGPVDILAGVVAEEARRNLGTPQERP